MWVFLLWGLVFVGVLVFPLNVDLVVSMSQAGSMALESRLMLRDPLGVYLDSWQSPVTFLSHFTA